jgi:tryptophanyl-tRNA synthetase
MTDPGHPETCNVCNYWRMFAPDRSARVWEECASAKRGCVQNKQELAEVLVGTTEPFRRARGSGGRAAQDIERLLEDGARNARAVAQQTMAEVKAAFGLAPR